MSHYRDNSRSNRAAKRDLSPSVGARFIAPVPPRHNSRSNRTAKRPEFTINNSPSVGTPATYQYSAPAPPERLARFLAHAGVASRRHAEELIASGRVQVNGSVITTQGARIDPARDRVCVDGKPVHVPADHVYLLLNKPTGYICTRHDPQQRPTVLDLLPPDILQLRVYPVGRLDIDTSGLLLLTNDGDFALHLSHPRYAKEKHYEALVQGHPSAEALAALRTGVVITEDDGRPYRTSPVHVRLLRQADNDSWLALTIHEGRKRQVRRMLATVGHPVHQLMRVGLGSLTLKGVSMGKWRYLTEAEVSTLLG